MVQPCPADSHTVSPSHVQLGFTDQPNCQAVSNGLYTPSTQSAQVVYMHAFRDRALCMAASMLHLTLHYFAGKIVLLGCLAVIIQHQLWKLMAKQATGS